MLEVHAPPNGRTPPTGNPGSATEIQQKIETLDLFYSLFKVKNNLSFKETGSEVYNSKREINHFESPQEVSQWVLVLHPGKMLVAKSVSEVRCGWGWVTLLFSSIQVIAIMVNIDARVPVENKLAVERHKTTRKVIFCRESTHLQQRG